MSTDFAKGQSGDHEMLAFMVGQQEFCVNVMAVREIRGWTQAIALPHAQDYLRGVVNLRGAVLPIVDLASRLGFEPAQPNERHVIIVSEIGAQLIGVLVDAVSGILNISRDRVQPTPAVASHLSKRFIEGIVPIDGRMISLLSLDKILLDDDMDDAA